MFRGTSRDGGDQGAHGAADLYRRPHAWTRAKLTFGAADIVGEAMTRLERCGGCPRLLLAAAAHHFLSLGPENRANVLLAYLRSQSSAGSESLAGTESFEQMEAIDAEFLEVMGKLMGWQPE